MMKKEQTLSRFVRRLTDGEKKALMMRLADPHGNNWKIASEFKCSPIMVEHLRNHFTDLYFENEKETDKSNIITFYKSA